MNITKKKTKNMLLKIMDEYYILKNYNCIIFITYFFMILWIMLKEFVYPSFGGFQKMNDIANHYNTLITVFTAVFIAVIPAVIKYHREKYKEGGEKALQNRKEKIQETDQQFAGIYSIEDFDTYYEENLILDRVEQIRSIEKILSELNQECEWIYLTGDSGAGKSTILKLLQKKLNALYFYSDYYNFDKIYEKIVKDNARYVFLDQFETALKYIKDIQTFFEKMRDKKVIFIISFRKEFMVDVEKILGQKPTHIVVQDYYDKEKMQDMIRSHYTYAAKTDIDQIMRQDFALLNSDGKIIRILFNAIDSDKLQMIAFEMIGMILEQKIDVEEFLQEEMPPEQFINSVIDYYFKQILPDTAKEKVIMLSILYLLSKDRILAARFHLEDFKNITFSSEEEIIGVLETLKEIRFVKKVNDRQYEISHDFIAGKVLYTVSAESMNADIIKNIDYYFHHIYLKKYDIQKNKIKDKIKKRYHAFTSERNRRVTNILMILSSIFSMIFFLGTFELNSSRLMAYERMIIVLLVGLSVFYVYNFFMNFMKMFRFFWIPEMGSIAVISLIFVNMNDWIFCLGLGITVIGLSHAFILPQIDWSARKYLQKNCILFSSFGVSIATVGICELVFHSSGYTKYFWYLFYFLYIMGAIMGHITPDYFAIRVGKANALKVLK